MPGTIDHAPIARSFPPIASENARVLVLGSMPGVASLEAQQYYAHPRNSFWRLMGELFGFDSRADYASRCRVLEMSGVAVWDVLSECRRQGSLDSSIDTASESPNDIAALLGDCPSIERVLFNGGKAESAFHRHVLPSLGNELLSRIERMRLPSTSPANAGTRYSEKLDAWRDALCPAGPMRTL